MSTPVCDYVGGHEPTPAERAAAGLRIGERTHTLNIASTRPGSVVHTRTVSILSGHAMTACGRPVSTGPAHVGSAYYWPTSAPVTCRRCLKVAGML